MSEVKMSWIAQLKEAGVSRYNDVDFEVVFKEDTSTGHDDNENKDDEHKNTTAKKRLKKEVSPPAAKYEAGWERILSIWETCLTDKDEEDIEWLEDELRAGLKKTCNDIFSKYEKGQL